MNAARNPSSSCIPCWIGGDSASPLNSDGHARGLDRLPHGVLHGDDRDRDPWCRSRGRTGPPRTRSGRCPRSVFLLNGSPTLSMPARSPLGLNSLVFSSAIAFSIAALRSGVSSRSTLGRREDEVEDAPCSEANCDLDEIRRLLRVRARDLELVLEAAADGGDEHDQPGDDREPARRRRATCDSRMRASSARVPPVDSRSCAASRSCSDMPKPPGWSLRVTTRLRVESHRSNWTACASPTVLPIRSRSARSRPLSFRNSARLTSDAHIRAARGRLRHPRPDPSRRSSGAVRSRLRSAGREHGGRRRLRRRGRRPGCGDGRRARASPARGD